MNLIAYLFQKGARMLSLILCAVFLQNCYHLPSPENYTPTIKNDEQMSGELEIIRKEYNQPAMATALIRGEKILGKASAGTLSVGQPEKVGPDHRFHIGSTTKAFTSLLIAILVEDGILRYDMPLEEALPGIDMRPEYRKVTLHDLLLNRGGIIPYQQKSIEDPDVVHMLEEVIPQKSNNPQVQRKLMTEYALSREPIFVPGTKSVYSNVGWSIVGYVAETVTGKAYEELVRERIFIPLGMKGARFGGWPASKSDPHQPRGHYAKEDLLRPQPLDDEYVLANWLNPAGGIHCNILDYAFFARETMLGLEGKGKLLPGSAYKVIHSIQAKEKINVMYQGAEQNEKTTLGYGWAVIPIGDEMLSVADGSAGTFYARIAVLPALDLAFAGFTNSGDGEKALSESIRRFTGLSWE